MLLKISRLLDNDLETVPLQKLASPVCYVADVRQKGRACLSFWFRSRIRPVISTRPRCPLHQRGTIAVGLQSGVKLFDVLS